MPSYHSTISAAGLGELSGLPLFPLKTKTRGPAPCLEAAAAAATPEGGEGGEDIVDEALRLFRANMLFRNFELQTGGDRVLVYLTLFIHQCLRRAAGKASKGEGARELATLASGAHVAPGDAAWPLGQVIATPKSPADLEALKGYLRQLRDCVAARLVDRVYNEDGTQNRHWMQYAKSKGFMGKAFQ
jgi:hypothetical protein